MHHINQCAFYKLYSLSKLAHILRSTLTELRDLSDLSNYSVRIEIDKKGKQREVQVPKRRLKEIQSRIKQLLFKIKTPEYLFSKKGAGHIKNGQFHKENPYLAKIDIRSFYNSADKRFVFSFLVNQMKMGTRAAKLLCNLVCYKNFIPTGSPSSQIVIYFTYSKTFDLIDVIAKKFGFKFSLYVDDLCFSSQDHIIPSRFLRAIEKELNKVFLFVKKKKRKIYKKFDYKIITGNALTPQLKLTIPNKLRFKIFQRINGLDISKASKQELQSLVGLIGSVNQICPNYYRSVLLKIKASLKKSA